MSVPAMALFDDCTYLGHEKHVADKMFADCWNQGYIALIDYSNEFGWVFHSISYPPHDTVWKKEIAAIFEERSRDSGRFFSEHEMELSLCKLLTEHKRRHERQILCSAGRIDIVTPTSIIELKLALSRDELYRAIGQAVTYRAAFARSLKVVIVALRIDADAVPIAKAARDIGIAVVIWDGQSPDIVNML